MTRDLFINGGLDISDSATNRNSTTGLNVIGSNRGDSYALDAKVAEILVFDESLSESELAYVNYYLSKKWGVETSIDSDGDGFLDESEELAESDPTDASDIPSLSLADEVTEYIAMDSELESIESDLVLWLDASNLDYVFNTSLSDGEVVSTWLDLSGNGNNMVQSSAGSQPILNDDSIVFDGSDDYLEVASFIETNENITKFVVLDVQSGGNYFCKTDGDSTWESGENLWWLGDGDTSGPGNYPSFVGNDKSYFMANQVIPSDQSLLFFQKDNNAYTAQNYTWASNGQPLSHGDTYGFYNNNTDTGTSFALGGCPTTYHGNQLYGGGLTKS